jgi:GTPase SAR1 family protein
LEGHRKRLEGAQEDLRLAKEAVEQAEEDSANFPLPQYLEVAQQEKTFLIAVVGNTGVGKSSWVNAVRRLRPTDPGAAKTGAGEVTLHPERYDYPGETAIPCAIWDLPGVGTTGYPPETYLRDLGIRYFDAAVLITDQRFTEAEMLLLDELRKFKVPFFLVRNKIDIDVTDEVTREEERQLDLNLDFDFGGLDDQVKRVIARDVIANAKRDLAALHGVRDVYCLSTQKEHWAEYDFTRLENDLAKAIIQQRGQAERKPARKIGVAVNKKPAVAPPKKTWTSFLRGGTRRKETNKKPW